VCQRRGHQLRAMTNIRRDHDQSVFIRKLDELAQVHGESIRSERLWERLAKELPSTVSKLTADHALYGLRSESMFAYVAAALGGCKIVRHEDAGMQIIPEDMAPPDFRLLTKENEEFFVEVKNHHFWRKPFRVRERYLSRLVNYATAFKKRLKFAIYWSQWGIWSLIDTRFLSKKGKYREIEFGPAMIRNEMVAIGDCDISTVPPLAIRLYANKESPREVRDDGMAEFRIGRVTFLANGAEISDRQEQSIALYLMMFGTWSHVEEGVTLENQLPAYFEMSCCPEQVNDEHEFQSVGFLSSMVSKCYDHHTSINGELTKLTPGTEPNSLIVSIPSQYKGKSLRLWRFYMHPKHASPKAIKRQWIKISRHDEL
jgi:hypothetical protein